MDPHHGEPAAWAAPLVAQLRTQALNTKRTHKLPSMPCVLWLPDYGAYLRSLDLCAASFTTSPNAEGAMRLAEELAEGVGCDLIEVTGVRVHLRAFPRSH